MNASQIVERPRKDWTVVKKAADAAGLTPAEYLVKLLSRHATYAEAARELGVGTRALHNYRSRYGVEAR